MNEKDHLSLTREELYSLAWAKPMTQLARDFGISDRALAKICVKRQVPVPPRGYWARRSAGQSVQQPPLLAFAANEKKNSAKPATPAAKKPKPNGIFDERNRTIRSILGILAVPDDAFALVLQCAVAHKIKFLTLRGEKLRYGRGDIYYYSLHEEQEE